MGSQTSVRVEILKPTKRLEFFGSSVRENWSDIFFFVEEALSSLMSSRRNRFRIHRVWLRWKKERIVRRNGLACFVAIFSFKLS